MPGHISGSPYIHLDTLTHLDTLSRCPDTIKTHIQISMHPSGHILTPLWMSRHVFGHSKHPSGHLWMHPNALEIDVGHPKYCPDSHLKCTYLSIDWLDT